MAVFPDKIVLKNSTDTASDVEAAIASGGSDEISAGELVIQRNDGSAYLYTLDSTGTPVAISAYTASAASITNQALIKLTFDSTVNDDTDYIINSAAVSSGVAVTAGAAYMGDGGLQLVRNANASEVSGEWGRVVGNDLWTCEFWLKNENTGSDIRDVRVFTQRDSGSPRSLSIHVAASAGTDTSGNAYGQWALTMLLDDQILVTTESAVDTTDNAWHHYVFQHEGGGTYSSWVDGALVRRNALGTVKFLYDYAWQLGTAATLNDASYSLNGQIDNFVFRAGLNIYVGSSYSLPTAVPPLLVSIIKMDDLRDVSAAQPTTGDVLVWNGSAWINTASATGPATLLDQLGDVDVSTVTPTNFSVLKYDQGTSTWVNSDDVYHLVYEASPALGANLALGNNHIGAGDGSNVILDPSGGGRVEILSTDGVEYGQILFANADASDFYGIQGPTGSSVAGYNLTLPQTAPIANAVLQTDASGQLSWATSGTSSLEGLTNVEIVSAQDYQVLTWDSTNSEWQNKYIKISTDTTPQLGGDLDLGGFNASSSGDLTLTLGDAATSGSLTVVTGNNSALTLSPQDGVASISFKTSNNLAETFLRGPAYTPGKNQNYSLSLPLDQPVAGKALITDASGQLDWGSAGSSVIVSENQPTVNNDGGALQDGDQWFHPVESVLYVYSNSVWVPVSGGSGGGSLSTGYVTQTLASDASGFATFNQLGTNGILVKMESAANAWVTLYSSAADRTADAARLYGEDPLPSSGVLAEALLSAGVSLAVSPGTVYFNADGTEEIYVAVRDTGNTPVVTNVTLDGYGAQPLSSGSNGMLGSTLVSETLAADAGTGYISFTNLGKSGTLTKLATNGGAWVTLYSSSAARTADASRSITQDPSPGSGVLAEGVITGAGELLLTPGTVYFNSDLTPTDAIYAAVRDQNGNPAFVSVTVTGYSNYEPVAVNTRTDKQVTTASLAADASEDVLFVNVGRAGSFVAIETSDAAWVTIYSDTASRTADAGRTEGDDPSPGSGVLVEIITTGAKRVKLTPVAGYFNDESTPVPDLCAKVVNKSGVTAAITVTATVIPTQS